VSGEDFALPPDSIATITVPVPRRRQGVCCHELDGEAVLYDVAHHTLHYLNATAFFILSRCDGQRRTEDIADELLGQHGSPTSDPDVPTRILSDVRGGLAELASNGLLEPDDGMPA
jgi:hypothetical protein